MGLKKAVIILICVLVYFTIGNVFVSFFNEIDLVACKNFAANKSEDSNFSLLARFFTSSFYDDYKVDNGNCPGGGRGVYAVQLNKIYFALFWPIFILYGCLMWLLKFLAVILEFILGLIPIRDLVIN